MSALKFIVDLWRFNRVGLCWVGKQRLHNLFLQRVPVLLDAGSFPTCEHYVHFALDIGIVGKFEAACSLRTRLAH